MAIRERTALVQFFCLLLVACPGLSTLINYQQGREYVYRLNSTMELAGVQKFFAKAMVGFVNIAEDEIATELLLTVHETVFSPEGQPDVNGHKHDYSRWFSFLISRRGEISKVYYPPDEEEEVIMLKKGFAGMLSAKIHNQHEIEHKLHADCWSYQTNEMGREGSHNSSYYVRDIPTGVEYTKIRTSNHIKFINGNTTYSKRVTINKELNTIHSVMMQDSFTMDFSRHDGFNPHAGMRPIPSVNEFLDLGLPGVSTYTTDYLEFVKTEPFVSETQRPLLFKNDTLQHVPNGVSLKMVNKTKEEVDNALEYIKGNLSCIRKQPEQGSPELSTCFYHLVKTLEVLPMQDLERIIDNYLIKIKPFSQTTIPERNAIVDALVEMQEQEIIMRKVLLSSSTDDILLKRVLTSLTSLEAAPIPDLIDTIYSYCFRGIRETNIPLSTEIQQLSCLTFGGLINSVKTFGDPSYAEDLVHHLHLALGLHDPYTYKQKRSTMTELESLEYDMNKVVLLDSIGNAGLQSSFEYILSHINSTNSQWIKRSGIHALRHYQNEEALKELGFAALYDDDENVRYEAMLQYQAHPLAGEFSNTSLMAVFDDGLSKRSILEKSLKFRLEAPGVDWRKVVGSSSIGGSFGVIMENLLDLQLSLLKGSLDVRVHDEAYVRIHLGFVGLNIDFFLARICFKGGAKYELNILQELDPKLGFDLIKQFKNIVNKVVGAVKNGVEALKRIVNADFSLKDIVDEFVASVKAIPLKIVNLASNIQNLMKKIALFKFDALPPFIKPVKTFVDAVVALYERIREDIMTFYNSIVEAVMIVIPQAAEQIFEAVQGIIKGFMNIFRDPKTSLFGIGKGVIMIYFNVQQLNTTKNKIMNNTFISDGLEPYWTNLDEDIDVLKDLFRDAITALEEDGEKWVRETVENNVIEISTKGKIALQEVKREIKEQLEKEIRNLLSPLDSLINIGGNYLNNFRSLFDIFSSIKDAFTTLKTGYEFARSFVDRIFGPKFHKDFPNEKRLSGGGCSGEGFYPSSLGSGNTEYVNDGLDVLAYARDKLVAPLAGTVILSDNGNEVIIIDSGELPEGTELVITNIDPAEDIMHPDDPLYEEKKV